MLCYVMFSALPLQTHERCRGMSAVLCADICEGASVFDAFPLVANEFEIDLGFLGCRRSLVEN